MCLNRNTEIPASPHRVVRIHSVEIPMVFLHALVFRHISERHRIADPNVQLIRNVRVTWPVSGKSALIHVQDCVDSMLIVAL